MHTLKPLFSLFTTCLFLLSISFPLTSFAEGKNTNSNDLSFIDALGFTEDENTSQLSTIVATLLESQERTISNMEVQLKELAEKLKTDVPKLREVTSQINNEFSDIKSLNSSHQSNPMELSILAKQMRRFMYDINSLYSPLLEAQQTTEGNLSQLSILINNFSSIETDQAKELLKRAKALNSSFTKLSKFLQGTLPNTAKLIEKISESEKNFEEKMPSLWLDYYLKDKVDIFNTELWKNEFNSLDVIKKTFLLSLKGETPANRTEWIILVTNCAFWLLIVCLLLRFLTTLMKRLPHAFKETWSIILKKSAPYLSIGLILHIVAWSNAGHYQLIATIGTFFLCYGEVTAAWQLCLMDREENHLKKSPLLPMVLVVVTSLLLLSFVPLLHMLSLFWLIFLVLCTVYFRFAQRSSLALPRALLYGFIGLNLLGVLLTLIGYVHLSIFITLLYICFAIGIHQATSLMHVSSIIQTYLPKKGLPALFSGLALSITLPVCLLLALLSPLAWILAYPGGEYIIKNFSNFDFNIGKVSFNAVQILSVLIVFYLTKSLISSSTHYIETSWQENSSDAAASLATPIKTVIIFGLWGLFAIYVLKVIGFNLTSLTFIAGGLSVGIGLGLQGIMQNIFSGFSLIFGQNIREGDVVEVSNIMGVVKKVSLRATQVRTFDNAVVFVPNSDFLASSFINWTHNGRSVRSIILIGVAYGSDLELVNKLILDTVKEHKKILKYPEPMSLFIDFAASSLNFELRYWVRDIDDNMTTKSEIRLALNKAFKENNIDIPFPQTDINIKTDEATALLAKAAHSALEKEKQEEIETNQENSDHQTKIDDKK